MNKRIISIIAIVALVAVLGVCLVACSKNVDTYANRLEKAGYDVDVATEESLEVMSSDFSSWMGGEAMNIKWAMAAGKGDERVSIYAFETKEQAEAFANMVNLTASDEKAETKGNIMFWGTAQGIKDAK